MFNTNSCSYISGLLFPYWNRLLSSLEVKSNITGPLEPTCIYAADSSRSSSMAWRPTLPCILWATTSDCKVPPLFTISSVDSPAYQLQLRVWPLQMTLTQITDLDLWPCSFRSDWQPGCKALIRRPPQEKRLQQTHPPRGQQQWQADRPTGAALVPAYWCGESLFLFQSLKEMKIDLGRL